MDLTYVARLSDGLILCETWDDAELPQELQPIKSQAKLVMRKFPNAQASKCSIDAGKYVFHARIDEGIIFMTICPSAFPARLAFLFLDEVHRAFEEELKREFGTVARDHRSSIETIEKPYYFIKFDRVIQKKRGDFRDPQSTRTLSRLNDSLVDVQNIMRSNVESLLKRGDDLGEVAARADDLKHHSRTFAVQARKLSVSAMLQKWLPLVVAVLVILGVVAFKFYM
eukprot:Polyplicarium_translucidae@DN1913_c0_g1_i1.p1